MTARSFDAVLDLYWPTLLPPVGHDGRSVLVYFGMYTQDGCATWVLVSEPVEDISSATCCAHGTRVQVVGSSKPVLGTQFVYATSISQVDEVPRHPERALPKLLLPFVVFGTPVLAFGDALQKAPLSLESVTVKRRSNVQGAPVVVRFKVDSASPHLRAMVEPGTTGMVVVTGVIDSFGGGRVGIRVKKLDVIFSAPNGDPTAKAAGRKSPLSFWGRAASFVKSHAWRFKCSLTGGSVSLSLLRELYALPGARLESLVLSFSLAAVPGCE